MWLKLGILLISFGASLYLKRRSFGYPSSLQDDKAVYSVKKIFYKNERRIYAYIFLIIVILFFILTFYKTRQQFLLWQNNAPAMYLIPPYQDINYFLKYSFYVFFAKPIIALLAALIFLGLTKFFNRKFQERFFEPEEPYFGALSIFLVDYPGWLFYLALLIFVYLIIHLSLVISHSSSAKKNRISLYYLWFPVAICVIIMQRWLELLPWWGLLKI